GEAARAFTAPFTRGCHFRTGRPSPVSAAMCLRGTVLPFAGFTRAVNAPPRKIRLPTRATVKTGPLAPHVFCASWSIFASAGVASDKARSDRTVTATTRTPTVVPLNIVTSPLGVRVPPGAEPMPWGRLRLDTGDSQTEGRLCNRVNQRHHAAAVETCP